MHLSTTYLGFEMNVSNIGYSILVINTEQHSIVEFPSSPVGRMYSTYATYTRGQYALIQSLVCCLRSAIWALLPLPLLQHGSMVLGVSWNWQSFPLTY